MWDRAGQAPVTLSGEHEGGDDSLSFSETLCRMPILSPVLKATLPPDPAVLIYHPCVLLPPAL